MICFTRRRGGHGGAAGSVEQETTPVRFLAHNERKKLETRRLFARNDKGIFFARSDKQTPRSRRMQEAHDEQAVRSK